MHILTIFISLFLFATNAFAHEIVAVIGEKYIITSDELEQVAKFTILLQSPENINNNEILLYAKRQILNELVEGKIVFTHAKAIGIDIEKVNISSELEIMAKKLPKHSESFEDFLMKYGIRAQYCKDHIAAQILANHLAFGMAKDKIASQESILAKLKSFKYEDTPENRAKVENYLINQNIMKVKSDMISRLRKLYYVEVFWNG